MKLSKAMLLITLASLHITAVHAENVYDPGNNTVSAQTNNSSIFGLDNTVNKNGTLSEHDTSVVNNAAILGRDNHVEFQGNISIDQATAVGTSNTIKGTNDTAVGTNNMVSGSWSFAGGLDNKVMKDNGVALGNGNTVSDTDAVAIGLKNTASMSGTVVVGSRSAAKAGWAVAIGAYANAAGSSSVAIGPKTNADKQSSIAIGYSSTAVNAFGVAIGGYQATAAGYANAIGYAAAAAGSDSVAIGTSTKASPNGSVALGAWSIADTARGQRGYDPSVDALSLRTNGIWKSTWGSISIGDSAKGATRQLTNLAAGTNDTDAVNVAQLKAARIEIDAGDNIAVTTKYGKDGHMIYRISGLGSRIDDGDYGVIDEPGKPDPKPTMDKSVVESADTRIIVTPSEAAREDGKTTTYQLKLRVDGAVEKGSSGLIDGNTVYEETRITKDGAYIRQGNTAGENLTALDRQVRTNADDITDTRNQITSLGTKVDRLDTRIDRVGAGAAALAGLHPLDFDAENKWDFAAGYGHYRSADAVAVGAFYRPNETTMVSIGGSLGGGETMLNVGVSLKFGKSSPYSQYSKAALIQTIESQNKRIERIDQENQELKSQIQDILQQLADLQRQNEQR